MSPGLADGKTLVNKQARSLERGAGERTACYARIWTSRDHAGIGSLRGRSRLRGPRPITSRRRTESAAAHAAAGRKNNK